MFEKPSCEMPPPQPGIERLSVEDAPPGADHGLVVERVHAAETRRESAVPVLLRIPRAVAGGTVSVAGEGETSGTATGTRIRADGSKKDRTSNFSDDGE